MRLYDRVMSTTMRNENARKMVDASRGAVVVDATNIARWKYDLVAASEPSVDMLKMFDRCVPAFALTCVEWRNPQNVGERWGCVVARGDHETDDGYSLIASAWCWMDDGGLMAVPVCCSVDVSGNGTPNWSSMRLHDYPELSSPAWVEQGGDTEALEKEILSAFLTALITFRFMHASNVKLVEHAATRQERRAAERDGKPAPTRYYTLEIEPITRRLESEGRVRELGIVRAMHLCRGHFADYTQGRGLFGKYKVEVFVPDHVRGSASRGVVVKDYSVRPISNA